MNDKTFPTPYLALNHVLQQLVNNLQDILDDNLVGVYLQGSFAVGDFDMHSDVDFAVVVAKTLSDEEVAALQEMHPRLYNLEPHWAQHLEGSYFPLHILQDHAQLGKPLWYLDNGADELVESDHCNTLIVRWVIREKGIVLVGPPPAILVNLITADVLREEIYGVINDWGQEILATPERYNNRFYQGFIVLSYCRMLHDLHTGVNGSKQEGAAWAKVHLDPAWTGLIDRAWNGRPNPAVSVRQVADPVDFAAMLEFVQYIIDQSNLFWA